VRVVRVAQRSRHILYVLQQQKAKGVVSTAGWRAAAGRQGVAADRSRPPATPCRAGALTPDHAAVEHGRIVSQLHVADNRCAGRHKNVAAKAGLLVPQPEQRPVPVHCSGRAMLEGRGGSQAPGRHAGRRVEGCRSSRCLPRTHALP
jgi:hypothetical protein